MSEDTNVPSTDQDLNIQTPVESSDEQPEVDMKNEDIDEGLEEQEALNQAAEQGIFFKDTYRIVKSGALDYLADEEGQLLIFKTEADAKAKIATLENPSQYVTAQVREQVPSE